MIVRTIGPAQMGDDDIQINYYGVKWMQLYGVD